MRRADAAGRIGLTAAFAAVAVFAVGAAWAGFASTTDVAHSVSSASLAAPAGLSAGNGSCTPVTGPRQVDLSWTATASGFADGYEVFRSVTSGAGFTSLGTVAGQGTTTYSDGTVAASVTYYYVVQATKNNWRSANSNEASVTTPNILCL